MRSGRFVDSGQVRWSKRCCTARSSRAHRTLTHRRWNQFGESESHGTAVALVVVVELVSWGKLELTQTLSQVVMVVAEALRIIVIGFSFYNAMTHTPCFMSHGQRVEIYVILDNIFSEFFVP